MHVNTSALEGAALDYAVALAEGYKFGAPRAGADGFHLFPLHKPGWETLGAVGYTRANGFSENVPRFSTDWAAGGPIIERDQIFLDPPHEVHQANLRPDGSISGVWRSMETWHATVSARTRTWSKGPDDAALMAGGRVGRGEGATALVACMRAYVQSKFGELVEIPELLA